MWRNSCHLRISATSFTILHRDFIFTQSATHWDLRLLATLAFLLITSCIILTIITIIITTIRIKDLVVAQVGQFLLTHSVTLIITRTFSHFPAMDRHLLIYQAQEDFLLILTGLLILLFPVSSILFNSRIIPIIPLITITTPTVTTIPPTTHSILTLPRIN